MSGGDKNEDLILAQIIDEDDTDEEDMNNDTTNIEDTDDLFSTLEKRHDNTSKTKNFQVDDEFSLSRTVTQRMKHRKITIYESKETNGNRNGTSRKQYANDIGFSGYMSKADDIDETDKNSKWKSLYF